MNWRLTGVHSGVFDQGYYHGRVHTFDAIMTSAHPQDRSSLGIPDDDVIAAIVRGQAVNEDVREALGR